MKWDLVSRLPCRGFTLIETLLVVVLLAIITVMATPSFVAWHVRDQVDARAQALTSTLAYARSEALRRGARVTVCRIDTARHCLAAGQPCHTGMADWSCGWAVLVERAGSTSLLRVQPELAAVAIAGAQTNLTFTPPAGQLIGSFRSFDSAPRTSSTATHGDAWRLGSRPGALAYLLTARGFGRIKDSQAWLQMEVVIEGGRVERHWRRIAARPF